MTSMNLSNASIRLALIALASAPLVACASAQPRPITVAPPMRILLEDHFQTYNPQWRQVRGQWAVGNGALLQARDDARELNTVMFYDPLTVADAEVITDLSVISDVPQFLTAGDDDLLASKRRIAGAGVIFRYQDQNNFYLFRTAGEEGVVLGKVINGEWHELANPRAMDFAGMLLRTETPYKLRVRVVGDRIQCWIGEKAVVNILDSSLGTGRVGLATFRSKAAFTSLRVIER